MAPGLSLAPPGLSRDDCGDRGPGLQLWLLHRGPGSGAGRVSLRVHTRVHTHRRVGAPMHVCTHTCMLGVVCVRERLCVSVARGPLRFPVRPLGGRQPGSVRARPYPEAGQGAPAHPPHTGRPRALWPSWVVLGVRWQEGVPRAPGLAAAGFRAGLPPMEGVRPEFWKPVFTPI